MHTNLVNQGLELMLVGMGTVFAFLALLVLATTAMSRLVLRFTPVPEEADVSDEELAAIAAAIAIYRGDT